MALTQYVENPKFEDYKELFEEHFEMERRNGIIVLRMQTKGKSAKWSWELHRAISQAFRTVGADPENEVMILTGTHDAWIADRDNTSFEGEEEIPDYCSYEYMYKDGRGMLNNLVHQVEIPTISALPSGPIYHAEVPLMCDLTICSEDSIIVDMHLDGGWVPGDGIHCALIELMGVKRAAWAMLMCQRIDAQKALEYGLVNEVVPAAKLMDRAWEIAERLNSMERITRRLATQVMRRSWKRRLQEDLDVGWSSEMWAFLADRPKHRQE